jgi:hypothetical protein
MFDLQPHVGFRLAGTLALQKYDPKEHPRDLARQYDKVQKREATLTVLPRSARSEPLTLQLSNCSSIQHCARMI